MKKIKNYVLLVLCTVLLCAGISFKSDAAIPSISNSKYIRTYSLKESNTKVYTSTSLSVRGTKSPYKEYKALIYPTDEIYVYSMNAKYAYVSYPTSSGRRYGYIKTSAITGNNYSVNEKTSTAKITTYKRAGGATYGSIAKGDKVWTTAQSGSYTQVVYPVGSKYKMGWIKTSDYKKYINVEPKVVSVAEGIYYLQSALGNNMVADVAGGVSDSGANVQLYEANGTTAQKFSIAKSGSYYTIKCIGSGKMLDVENGSTASGANVQQYEANGTDSQKWLFIDAGNGYYYIKSALGNYLDVDDGGTANGTNIQVYTGNQTAAQKWKLLSAQNVTIADADTTRIEKKLVKMMNGTYYQGAYKVNTKYTGPYASEQCKGFAKSVFEKLFGYNIGSTKDNNYQISYDSSKTTQTGVITSVSKSTAKTLFSKGKPGDFVQMRRTHGGPHSAILYAVSADGVTFYEANTDGKNGIRKNTYSWADLAKANNAMSLYTYNKYYSRAYYDLTDQSAFVNAGFYQSTGTIVDDELTGVGSSLGSTIGGTLGGSVTGVNGSAGTSSNQKTQRKITAAASNENSITVQWDKDEDADAGYRIYIKGGKFSSFTKVTDVFASATEYTIEQVGNKELQSAVEYTVKAVSLITENGDASEGEEVICKAMTLPGSTSIKASSKAAKKSVTLRWKKAARADGYEIQISTKKKTGYKLAKTVSKNKNTVKIAKLKKNKKYYFKVRAYKVYNNTKYYGAWSKAASIKTKK